MKFTSDGQSERIQFMRSPIVFTTKLEEVVQEIKHLIAMFHINPIAPEFNEMNEQLAKKLAKHDSPAHSRRGSKHKIKKYK